MIAAAEFRGWDWYALWELTNTTLQVFFLNRANHLGSSLEYPDPPQLQNTCKVVSEGSVWVGFDTPAVSMPEMPLEREKGTVEKATGVSCGVSRVGSVLCYPERVRRSTRAM